MEEQTFTDLLINTPSDEKTLPHVTPAILCDAFQDQQVLLGGDCSDRWVLRWFVPISRLDSDYLERSIVPISQLLVVAEPHDIPELSDRFPNTFFMTQISTDEQLTLLEPYEKKLLALKDDGSKIRLLLRLQNLFLRMLLWEDELEKLVLRQGSMSELLDASTPIIGNFIFVSDNDFNIIAQTSTIEPPDELHRRIISNGCLTQATIAEKRFRLPEKTFYTRRASDICPFDRVSYPIHINHSYYGSVSMACDSKPDTEGLRDLFSILIRQIKNICERDWISRRTYDIPSYFFFEKLLQRDPMTDEHIAMQMAANKLPEEGHFKVMLFDIDPSIDPELAYKTMRAASLLHDGRTKCFQYQHNVVAFSYGTGIDGELSHQRTFEEVAERIYRPLKVEVGISSVYTDIRNTDLAFKQAQIALAFRGAIERELETSDPRTSLGAYLFEDALLYYLIDPASKDQRFLDFIFDNSIVNILWKEDMENGTNYVALLWFYLQSERNATLTAQRLHMHRNTVLYHMDKIERRFDFDMDNKSARDWLLISFKAFFSSQSSESLASLLSDENDV